MTAQQTQAERNLQEENLKLRRTIEDERRLREDSQSPIRDQFAMQALCVMLGKYSGLAIQEGIYFKELDQMVCQAQDYAELILKEGRKRDNRRLEKLRDKEMKNKSRKLTCTSCNITDGFSVLEVPECKTCGRTDFLDFYIHQQTNNKLASLFAAKPKDSMASPDQS